MRLKDPPFKSSNGDQSKKYSNCAEPYRNQTAHKHNAWVVGLLRINVDIIQKFS